MSKSHEENRATKCCGALAYKWQRIMFRCWQNQEPYDEERYIAALRRRHSPLITKIDSICADAA